MKLRFFGGIAVDGNGGVTDGGAPTLVPGRGQQALLFRLAVDASTTVTYRALAEDIWGTDAPADPRASLHSLASRLRKALPTGTLEAVPGGYRLNVPRDDIDITRFADLVARARRAADPGDAASLAQGALSVWAGDPWTPGDGFDWVVRDLLEDRAHAERLAGGPRAVTPSPRESAVPAALTPLVGREPELALIEGQLAVERLVTIVGPGGAGKTTLALETARHHTGVILVELAPVAAGVVWSALAGAVGRTVRLPDSAVTPLSARDRVIQALAGREVLLVLDNCEHVSREAAEVALDLLQTLPGSRVLATSREPLGVPGEAFVDLGPLPISDGIELFERRMRAATGAPPDASDAATVAGIVQRLDGLPLAVELAAAKTRTLSLAEIAAGLDDRFGLLGAGPRGLPARHQTLRALIDWSWDTLSPAERTALQAVAVFPDGIAASDAAVVGGHVDLSPSAFDELVDRSLLTRRDGRFRMLETVRAYGLDRLRAGGDEAVFRAAQAEAMAELAAARDQTLRGPGVRAGLGWFDANEDNLASALRYCADSGRRATGVRLVRALLWPWVLRERVEDLASSAIAFDDAEAALESEPAVVVAGLALLADAFPIVMAGAQPPNTQEERAEGARAFAERGQQIIAAVRQHPSDLSSALPPLVRSIGDAVANRAQDLTWANGITFAEGPAADAPPWTHAFLSALRAGAAQNAGDVETLGTQSESSLRVFRELGDPWGIAFAGQLKSEWLMLEGRLEEALETADRSTAALTGLTSSSDAVQQRSSTVGLLLRLGRIEEARARRLELEDYADRDGSERAMMQVRMIDAVIEIAVGDGEAALGHLTGIDPVSAGLPPQLTAWRGSKLAQALVLLDRVDEAREALLEAVPPSILSGDQPIMADVALSLAGWLVATGQDAAARRAFAVSSGLRGRPDETDPFRIRMLARMAAAPEEEILDAAAEFVELTALLR
ncbi:ATP-binding protein [Microbacterium sp. P04]|uniref:ATP-binding protein n=1 Tax=Microbacterium sp. P04 TaxID=3366947 RepID=UPI0037460C22